MLSELTISSAKIIITVMFAAVKYGDVSKQQIASALKKFKVKWRTTNSKDEMALLLAKAFLQNNYVEAQTDRLTNLQRSNVHKITVF